MSYSDFRKTATERDLELATLLAALWGLARLKSNSGLTLLMEGTNHDQYRKE